MIYLLLFSGGLKWYPLQQAIEYVAYAITFILHSAVWHLFNLIWFIYFASDFASILFVILVFYLPSHSIRGEGFSPWLHSYFPERSLMDRKKLLGQINPQEETEMWN